MQTVQAGGGSTGQSAVQPHVSIVTPVYNAAPFLAECREGVVSQTHTAWDWTIVDNLSTDGTYGIAKEFSRGDRRIRVMRNDRFVNAEANHNRALREISDAAKYCKVVAADDIIFPDCIRRMVEVAEAHPRVAIVGSYALRGDRVAYDGFPFPDVHVNGRVICRRSLLGGPYIFGTPTSVLYRADIVRNRFEFYNESNTHADTEVCYEVLMDADMGFVHQVLSYERIREASESSFSTRMNTHLYGRALLILKYGHLCLSDDERERKTREIVSRYYRFLGHQALRRREPEFWEFHRTKLEELGLPLSRLRLLRGSAESAIQQVLLSPMALARRFLRGPTSDVVR